MSVNLFCHKKPILCLSNLFFDSLHKELIFVNELQPKRNNTIDFFLEKTDQDTYGLGVVSRDIAKYFPNKNDVLLFAHLVKQVLDQKQKSEYPWREDVYKLILNFHQKLLKHTNILDK